MSSFQGVTNIAEAETFPTWHPQEVGELLTARFFDDVVCTDWFLRRCYPNGAQCPRCGAALTDERILGRWRAFTRVTCPSCRRKIKATAGTILHESQLSPRQLFILLALLGIDVDLDTVARVVGITVATVKAWRDKVIVLAEVSQ